MKKCSILYIVLAFLLILLVANFLFHIFYFNLFHKSLSSVSDSERREVMEILDRELSLDECQVEILNAYFFRDRELVQVDLIKGGEREHYLVDMERGRITKK